MLRIREEDRGRKFTAKISTTGTGDKEGYEGRRDYTAPDVWERPSAEQNLLCLERMIWSS